MKALILGAGYGTRLERDLKVESSKTYEHLVGIPKPLLPIGGKPLITRWMEVLQKAKDVDEVFVVTNALYLENFQQWAADWPQVKVKVICDGTTSNESRLGAVADIQLCIEYMRDTDDADLLVIGGDTLFFEDFSLNDVLQSFYHRRQKSSAGGSVLCYKCKDSETTKFGILEINVDKKVTAFMEKPSPESTPSRWACPCFYVISHHSLPLVKEFLEEKKGSPIKERDAPGNFIRYLQTREPIYATIISGRFDVGGLQSYIACDNHFKSQVMSEVMEGSH